MAILNNDWNALLECEFSKPYYLNLRHFLVNEYRDFTVYPDMSNIFNALNLTSYQNAKVVILGQDPYHGPGQAHGIGFSVKVGTPIPPSLKNIFKELVSDLGCSKPINGDLSAWAKQGVLLLNTVLTVREDSPNSHRRKGWEQFTDSIIEALNARQKPLVFILWGANAQAKQPLITSPQHLIIKTPHPSPLSATRGFFGSKPFSRTNHFLEQTGQSPIDWEDTSYQLL